MRMQRMQPSPGVLFIVCWGWLQNLLCQIAGTAAFITVYAESQRRVLRSMFELLHMA